MLEPPVYFNCTAGSRDILAAVPGSGFKTKTKIRVPVLVSARGICSFLKKRITFYGITRIAHTAARPDYNRPIGPFRIYCIKLYWNNKKIHCLLYSHKYHTGLC